MQVEATARRQIQNSRRKDQAVSHDDDGIRLQGSECLDRLRLFAQPLGRHVGGPGVFVFEPVEVVAPERLLIASPTQPPLVDGAVADSDAAVEEASVVSPK